MLPSGAEGRGGRFYPLQGEALQSQYIYQLECGLCFCLVLGWEQWGLLCPTPTGRVGQQLSNGWQ